jgi:hypothetical protein
MAIQEQEVPAETTRNEDALRLLDAPLDLLEVSFVFFWSKFNNAAIRNQSDSCAGFSVIGVIPSCSCEQGHGILDSYHATRRDASGAHNFEV